MPDTHRPQVTPQERDVLTEALGVETVGGESVTITDIREALDEETDERFQSVGPAVRADLTGSLDADLLDRAIEEMEARMERISEVRDVGVPEGEAEAEELYRELVEPAWEVYDHLADIGFFESLDGNMPKFTEETIDTTTQQLAQADAVTETLSAAGFDDHEQTVLFLNIANNKTRLSRWVPTSDIPEGVEFDVEYVPPLHQRSMGGALLWVNALDDHLWRKEILVTEEILDDAFWYTKAIVAGLYTLTRGVRAFADENTELSGAEATAALIGGSAMLIVNQEELMKDVFWINEADRAPTPAR